MQTISNILIYIFSLLTIFTVEISCSSYYCPKYCRCDVFKNLNRADCSGQKLISPNVNVPDNVQILDLSKNGITTLDNSCFEGLSVLSNLTLSNNNIHTIYLDAFAPLKSIKDIDLSNNRLESFDSRVFENNDQLLVLNLSGNKFMFLKNDPFVTNKWLKHLILRDSKIAHIYSDLFMNVPSVTEIDLSENLFITVKSTPFRALKKLKFINLEGNRWICDKNTEMTLKYLKRQNIDVRLSKCKFENQRTKPIMFERMMVMPTDAPSTTGRTETNVEFIWNRMDKSNNTYHKECSNDVQVACNLYEKCMSNYRELMQRFTYRNVDYEGLIVKEPCYINFRREVLIWFGLGVLATLLIITSSHCMKKLMQKSRQRLRIHRQYMQENRIFHSAAPILPSGRTPTLHRSTLRPLHRRERSRSNWATSISKIFERPRRRQLHNAINQQTANVIRRISRSNSRIASRLSAHMRDGHRILDDHEQSIESQSSGLNSQFEDEPSANSEQHSYGTTDLVTVRSETPPPTYKDVIQNPQYE